MPPYDKSVFINCPFDEPYARIFSALVFAVHDSGFFARCAMEADNAGEVRIQKIARIIRDCRHGIHDLSRTDLDKDIGLPRFNMPLELGIFLGAQMIAGGRQREKNCLVLDVDRYRYRNFCSDISGQDVKAHGGEPQRALEAVRNWLGTFSVAQGLGTIPGPKKMSGRYTVFVAQLPVQCAGFHLEPEVLGFVELRTLVQEWLDENPVCTWSHRAPAESGGTSLPLVTNGARYRWAANRAVAGAFHPTVAGAGRIATDRVHRE